MSRARVAWKVVASGAVLLVLLTAGGVFLLQSRWFYEQVRERIVSTVETATGGRAELGGFRFDWKRLRAEVQNFTLHGTEPAGKPPLFHASSVAVGLKIVSALKRDVDIQYLELGGPAIYLIVYPDGRTNIPAPKIKGSDRSAVETLLNLAIGRFDLRDGIFELESQGRTPFDAHGRNLALNLLYETEGPRYRGNLAMDPLEVHWPGAPAMPLGLRLALAIEKNRISVSSGNVSTGATTVEFSGAVEDLVSPRGSFRYNARVSVKDAARILNVAELERGTVELAGEAAWTSAAAWSATGKMHAYGLDYRDSTVALRNYRADGAVTAGPSEIGLKDVRLSGAGPCLVHSRTCPDFPVSGRIGSAALRGRELDFTGIALAVAGGRFNGTAHLRDLDHYTVSGDLADFAIRQTVALYSPEALPWDGMVSGSMKLDGSLKTKTELRGTADLAISPAAQGTPVQGHITAAYEARSGLLDLGHSTLALPSSRADFSGVLPAAAGRELRVHLETRDLNDILPALGEHTADFPVKLQNGTAVFDGTATGNLNSPKIAGHLAVAHFSAWERALDSLDAEVAASPAGVEARNATVARGALRAQFQGSAALRDWKLEDTGALAGAGAIHNADLPALLPLLDARAPQVTGALSATAQVSGTIGDPRVSADLDVAKGAFREEPFDRFTAHADYTARSVQVANGLLALGAGQVNLTGNFDHAPGIFDAGKLRFQVRSSAVSIEQIHAVGKLHPDIKGTVQVVCDGDLDIQSPSGGRPDVRITSLHADVAVRGLQLTGQTVGDTHVTAESRNAVLQAHLESNFADSAIRGEGEWRLEGNYPGTATITFSKLDFAQLRRWIAPGQSVPESLTGFAEGELRVSGPALEPQSMKAELRIPKFELASTAPVPAGGTMAPPSFALQNSGPLVATMANKILTVEAARFVGRATDLGISGRVLLDQKNAFDLRVNGKLDLAIVHDLNHDLVSTGTVNAEAAIRGALDAPQVNGRLQFDKAAFSLADFPNGISNANGVIALSNNRATIESFTGETGGGKIRLAGFGSYGEGGAVFRLFARAEQVRVRYPEGVSTVANASLNLTGTSDRSQLAGTITILRTGINLQSDFSSFIARSAEPVRTPAVQTGFLGGLNFDVQIETAPDIQFQSALTQDLQADANLRLRGTFSNPALLGRVTFTQGQVVFYGTKYTVNQGSISFYNPLKIEPIVDIDLQTRARGIDITLTVAGPLNKLTLTPRSDPPLQFNEIVGLLATGRTPTYDPASLTQQSNAPQSWQQMGASALLGQAIANPVAGRLQRFFGVSALRIDPTIEGVENNPQARLTLEQQVTPEITFTYITNVTSTNPQVVRMEWALNKKWSVVALREENGTFGVDFFFKKQF